MIVSRASDLVAAEVGTDKNSAGPDKYSAGAGLGRSTLPPSAAPAGTPSIDQASNVFPGKVVVAAESRDNRAIDELTEHLEKGGELRQLVREPSRDLEPDEAALRTTKAMQTFEGGLPASSSGVVFKAEQSSNSRRLQSCVQTKDLKKIKAELCEPDIALEEMIIALALQRSSLERVVLEEVFKKLVSHVGGSIVVMCDIEVARQLNLTSLDGNGLMHVLDASGSTDADKRISVLEMFLQHADSDRWEIPLVERLLASLGIDKKKNEILKSQLVGQPKDGALVMSLVGQFLAAEVQLRHSDHVEHQIIKQDAQGVSKGVGTRHASALGVVEFMGKLGGAGRGVVMASSDAGGVTVMIPAKETSPKILFVECKEAGG